MLTIDDDTLAIFTSYVRDLAGHWPQSRTDVPEPPPELHLTIDDVWRFLQATKDEPRWIVYEPFFKLWIGFYSERDGDDYKMASLSINRSIDLSDYAKRERLARILSPMRHTVRWDLPPMIELPPDLAWADRALGYRNT